MGDRRGVSSVVGVVLIVGLTLATITAILAAGTVIIGDAQNDAYTQQMENSMAQMSSKASLVALADSSGHHFDLGSSGDGTIEVREMEGSVSLYYEINESADRNFIIDNESLGALVYENGDVEIAYQGGGVWRKEGTMSSIISPPEYHYRQETLTFPILRITGEGTVQGDTTGFITQVESGVPLFPNESDSELVNPIEEGSVKVEIQSRYCMAWEQYFSTRTDSNSVEPCDENQTVVVDLSVPFSQDASSAIAVQEDYDIHHNSNVSSVEEGVVYPSPSEQIDDRIEGCENESSDCESFEGEDEFNEGVKYFSNESIEVDEELTFNTENGSIEVVIDGDLDMGQNNINIEGNGNVSIYLKGEFEMGNQEINEGGSADQLFVYVHSDVETIQQSGNPTFTGVIYAPNTDIDWGGNVDIFGAVIANSLNVDGAASEIHFDPILTDSGLGIPTEGSDIRYLHVSDNIIAIELS